MARSWKIGLDLLDESCDAAPFLFLQAAKIFGDAQ